MDSVPYINIHTHSYSGSSNVIEIQSLHLQNWNPVQIPSGYFSLGLHPWYASTLDIDKILTVLSEVQYVEKFLAIGEIGLDKVRVENNPLTIQNTVFESQLIFAQQTGKPVVLHNVHSTGEILHLLKKYKITIPVIFHGYTGKYETALQILHAGAYLSFGKALQAHRGTIDALKNIPLDKVFFETDDSNLNIETIYSTASAITSKPVDELKEQCYTNFQNIFTVNV